MGNSFCRIPVWHELTLCYKRKGDRYEEWTCYHDISTFGHTEELANEKMGPDLVGPNPVSFLNTTPMWIRTIFLRYIHLPRPVGKITNVYSRLC